MGEKKEIEEKRKEIYRAPGRVCNSRDLSDKALFLFREKENISLKGKIKPQDKEMGRKETLPPEGGESAKGAIPNP